MNLFEHLASFIIRPHRHDYRLSNLGAKQFEVVSALNGTILHVIREDRIIRNRNGFKLHLSHYMISNGDKQQLPTLLYLHANNGSRIQGLAYLKFLLEKHINVVLFDFSGSGMSEGEYVTLGVRESQDLEDIIEVLYGEGKISDFALWGRSMGAVTALMYCSRAVRLPKACIYDSPFSSLEQLIHQVAAFKTGLPDFFISPLLSAVERNIKQRAQVNFNELRTKDKVHLIRCPGLFLTSKTDRLVNYQHCQQLYKLYPAEKAIEFIDCQHHQPRGKDIIATCVDFIRQGFDKARHFTYVDPVQGLSRAINFDTLGISILRTPPHLQFEERTFLHSSKSKGSARKMSKQELQQERTPNTKISLTQLKCKQKRMTETPVRDQEGGSAPNHSKFREQQNRTSKVLNFKKEFLDKVTSESHQHSSKHLGLEEGEITVRKLHYKLK